MNFNSQKNIVLDELKNGSITSWQMIKKHNITRLSAHILQLRNEGHSIMSTREYNENSWWTRYHLIKK